ncbi:MAG: hypothetical protein AB7O04_08370 [Hyphomonadaceae bacterium]
MEKGKVRLAAMGLALLTLGACASSGSRAEGDDDTRMERTRRGITSAAATPLRDVGLIRPDIPDLLENLRYPYSTLTLAGGCPNVLYEIGQLDAVLGIETYQPAQQQNLSERGMDAASNAAVDAVEDTAGGVVPFRGWVRRLSGAQRADARYARAIEMGELRRAFLRGYGASLGCRFVVPPPPPIENANRNTNQSQAQTQHNAAQAQPINAAQQSSDAPISQNQSSVIGAPP